MRDADILEDQMRSKRSKKVVSIAGRIPKSWQPKSLTLPREIGPIIDLLVRARARRKKLEGTAEAIKAEERNLKDHMLRIFTKEQIDGARGRLGSVHVAEKDVPKVVSKEEFGKYVAKHRAWDLLYGKATEEGCQARWDAGEEIGGVEKYHQKDVRLTEAKEK